MSRERLFDFRGTSPAKLVLIAVLSLAMLGLAACGGDDEGGTEPASEEAASEQEGGEEAGGGPVAEVQDKSIGYVDVVATSPLQIRWANAFERAANEIGWEVQLQDAAGDPSTALTATRDFVNTGMDAVVMSSIAAEWIRPAAGPAEQAGIPLVNLISRASPGVFDADIDEEAAPYSQALAEKLQEDFPDGARVGILVEREVPLEVERIEELDAALEGSGIELVAEEDIPLSDQPSAQRATVDMVNANPDIDAIVSISGVLPQFALPGLRTLGREDIRIYSWYADSLNADLMQQHEQFVAVVDSDIAKASFVAIDELLKHFTGEEMTEQMYVDVEPVIVTTDDISPSIEANEGPIPYDELIEPYLERWGSEYGLGPEA